MHIENRLTRVFQEHSGQVTVSVKQRSQQQPGIASRVRGQQPQLTRGGRLAHKAVSESGKKENKVDSSAVSGECTHSNPFSKRQQRREKLHKWKTKTEITVVLGDNLGGNSVYATVVSSFSVTHSWYELSLQMPSLSLTYSVHREGISSNLGQLKPN